MADRPPIRGTVTAILSRRDPRGDRIAVQWDGSISGELWARASDRVVVGERVEATRDGTPLVLRWIVVTTLDSGARREAASSEERAVDLFNAARDAWTDDDRFVGVHIEGPDGQRYHPTRQPRGLFGLAYGLPLELAGGAA